MLQCKAQWMSWRTIENCNQTAGADRSMAQLLWLLHEVGFSSSSTLSAGTLMRLLSLSRRIFCRRSACFSNPTWPRQWAAPLLKPASGSFAPLRMSLATPTSCGTLSWTACGTARHPWGTLVNESRPPYQVKPHQPSTACCILTSSTRELCLHCRLSL